MGPNSERRKLRQARRRCSSSTAMFCAILRGASERNLAGRRRPRCLHTICFSSITASNDVVHPSLEHSALVDVDRSFSTGMTPLKDGDRPLNHHRLQLFLRSAVQRSAFSTEVAPQNEEPIEGEIHMFRSPPPSSSSSCCVVELSKESIDNLRQTFFEKSSAAERYRYFARRADGEGYAKAAACFESLARGARPTSSPLFPRVSMTLYRGERPCAGGDVGDRGCHRP